MLRFVWSVAKILPQKISFSSIQFRLIFGAILLVVILAGLFLPSFEEIVTDSANVYVPNGVEEAFDVTDGTSIRVEKADG